MSEIRARALTQGAAVLTPAREIAVNVAHATGARAAANVRCDCGPCDLVGGGIAGLIAAPVLSEHFIEVVVTERDPLEDMSDPRRGRPQGRHIHPAAAGMRIGREPLLDLSL